MAFSCERPWVVFQSWVWRCFLFKSASVTAREADMHPARSHMLSNIFTSMAIPPRCRAVQISNLTTCDLSVGVWNSNLSEVLLWFSFCVERAQVWWPKYLWWINTGWLCVCVCVCVHVKCGINLTFGFLQLYKTTFFIIIKILKVLFRVACECTVCMLVYT